MNPSKNSNSSDADEKYPASREEFLERMMRFRLRQGGEKVRCENCGHTATHGKYGCEHEGGDRWVDYGNGDRLVASGPCGCMEFYPATD